ncbi:hypothetical protein [Bradyrhizobium genosp. P]|uniref:hypothetical protein n=1 Tax=Bradyrhizobium genosp. P TaxID=83641 RepID=UPI003CEA965E
MRARSHLDRRRPSVDRHIKQLVEQGALKKLSGGLYACSKERAFGPAPASDKDVVGAFLKDDRFLLASPNAYNSLGLGTTQLYDKTVVYNHKRHGDFRPGSRTFAFRVKPHFPRKLTKEFLLVDLVNNLEQLAEAKDQVLRYRACGRVLTCVRPRDATSTRRGPLWNTWIGSNSAKRARWHSSTC